jgi:uncharacterized membrane protein YhaH (DUF805 family)
MKWYITALKKYGVFKGRASRREYWMFVLFNIIFAIAALLLDNLFRITIQGPNLRSNIYRLPSCTYYTEPCCIGTETA